MDNPAPLPAPLSDKARALLGLSDDDRQALLAAAGALGLSSEHDPFWIVQATITQMKSLISDARADAAEAREAAEETLAEARAVAKAIQPASEAALGHIKATVSAVETHLVDLATTKIANAAAGEMRDQIQTVGSWRAAGAQIIGAAVATLGLTAAFAFGNALGAGGWRIVGLPGAVLSVGVPGLLIGQILIVAASSVLWAVSRGRG